LEKKISFSEDNSRQAFRFRSAAVRSEVKQPKPREVLARFYTKDLAAGRLAVKAKSNVDLSPRKQTKKKGRDRFYFQEKRWRGN
jgi:hypothetical protein